MKTLLYSIIILSFVLTFVLTQTAFGYNPTLEDQLGNSSTTKLVHDGSILILNQTTQKLAYEMGENITINTELVNLGNKTVAINYCEPWVVLEIKNQTGDEVWPNTQLACIPEFGGTKILQPGEHLNEQPWGFTMQPNVFPSPKLSLPGNYTAVSVAVFRFDTHTKNLGSVETLWSKPIQITILPVEQMDNPTNSLRTNQDPELGISIENETANQTYLQEQLDLGHRHTISSSSMAERQAEDVQNTTLVVIFVSVSIGIIISVFMLSRRKK